METFTCFISQWRCQKSQPDKTHSIGFAASYLALRAFGRCGVLGTLASAGQWDRIGFQAASAAPAEHAEDNIGAIGVSGPTNRWDAAPAKDRAGTYRVKLMPLKRYAPVAPQKAPLDVPTIGMSLEALPWHTPGMAGGRDFTAGFCVTFSKSPQRSSTAIAQAQATRPRASPTHIALRCKTTCGPLPGSCQLSSLFSPSFFHFYIYSGVFLGHSHLLPDCSCMSCAQLESAFLPLLQSLRRA